DVETARPRLRTLGHRGSIDAAAISPDGTLIALGGGTSAVTIWDARALRPLRSLDLPFDEPARDLAWSPDGERLAVSQKRTDGVFVFSLATGERKDISQHGGKVHV